MSKITFQREMLRDLRPELEVLLDTHYKEIGLYNDKLVLNPVWDNYLSAEDLGVLHILTARDGDKLVGYYISFVQPHLHYSGSLFSMNDILFLHPNYRKGFTAVRMFKFAENYFKEMGVEVMCMTFKTYAPFDKILERLDWDYSERLYTKYIGDE